jgi:hypothetical protein
MGWGNTRSLGCLVIVSILSGHLSMHGCLNSFTPKFDIAEQQIHFRNSNGCDIDTRGYELPTSTDVIQRIMDACIHCLALDS